MRIDDSGASHGARSLPRKPDVGRSAVGAPGRADGSVLSPEVATGIATMHGGKPLPSRTRAFFEPRFRRSLAHVRLHDDPTAAQINHELGSRAFAFGPNIAFASGQYRLDTGAGQKLLAHELAHVVLQAGLPSPPMVHRFMGPTLIPPFWSDELIEYLQHLRGAEDARAVAEQLDAESRTLKRGPAKAKAIAAAKADAIAAEHSVAALELTRMAERSELALGKTRGGREVKAFYFKGLRPEVALVIAGVHGSELSGVEVAETLIAQLSTKGVAAPYYSVVIVPEVFPDNVDAKRVWERDLEKTLGELSQQEYRAARKRSRDPGRVTLDRRPGAAKETNRAFPELGKPFDPENPVDMKGRPIERENIILLTLIDRLRPIRIASLHAIKSVDRAGIFADPHPSSIGSLGGGLPQPSQDLAKEADELALAMAKSAKSMGAKVPGNLRGKGKKWTSLYPGQNPKLSPKQIAKENKRGRSAGQWVPSRGMVVLTIEVQDQYASTSPVQHPGRKREIEAHATALREIFLGPPRPAAGK